MPLQNSDSLIRYSLNMANAHSGVSRRDHFRDDFENAHRKSENEIRELEMLKDSTQVLSVGSVLIVTVTFGATFALPGGYRADGHTDGGSPTLAGRYAFLAFVMANTVALMCSAIATVGFMYSGSPMVHLESRTKYIDASIYFMQASITSLVAAFTLGMYSVLSPVAPATATTICVIGPLVVACSTAEFLFKAAFLVRAFWVRKGPLWTLVCTMLAVVVCCLAFFWPVIFIFGWAAHQRDHPTPTMVPAAQPPMPFP